MGRLWLALALVLSCSSSAYAQTRLHTRLAPELMLSVAQLPPLAPLAPLTPFDTEGAYEVSDPRPSSGMGLIIAGWIMTGIGVLNLAAIPVCYADFYPQKASEVCAVASAVLGGVLFAVGVPFLIVGYGNRSDYRAWQERHGGVTGQLLKLHIALERNATWLLYRAEL